MGRILPYIYDLAMAPLERARFRKIRASLVNQANGNVLEIGSGTGANFPYYANADKVDAIEPNRAMVKLSLKRTRTARVPINVHASKAESLPFADSSFDTIVSTLVFCTIPDPEKALQEIKRVSKDGATFLLFEHVRMDREFLGKTQDALTPMWKKLCDGCHLNRNTLELLKREGFFIKKVEMIYGGLFLTIECIVPKA